MEDLSIIFDIRAMAIDRHRLSCLHFLSSLGVNKLELDSGDGELVKELRVGVASQC